MPGDSLPTSTPPGRPTQTSSTLNKSYRGQISTLLPATKLLRLAPATRFCLPLLGNGNAVTHKTDRGSAHRPGQRNRSTRRKRPIRPANFGHCDAANPSERRPLVANRLPPPPHAVAAGPCKAPLLHRFAWPSCDNRIRPDVARTSKPPRTIYPPLTRPDRSSAVTCDSSHRSLTAETGLPCSSTPTSRSRASASTGRHRTPA